LLDHYSRGIAGRRIERHVAPEAMGEIPQQPGVYLMHNQNHDLLYVGKATRLRDRVRSYFGGDSRLNGKIAELVNHVWHIETRPTRSALEAALLEARLIREFKPPYNRMLKSAAPAWFIRIDLNDPFPRLRATQRLTAKVGVLQIGPFVGRRNIEHSLNALSHMLGLRSCGGRLEPDDDFSPCIFGQIGHCAAPCNLGISEEAYNFRVSRAISFLRGRSGPLLAELVRARDQAAAAMRFEAANRHHRSLEALATLAERTTRLSRVVTENNLVVVLGGQSAQLAAYTKGEEGKPVAPGARVAYVVLSGRLALIRELDSPQAAVEVAGFVAGNYAAYTQRPVRRDELEPMIVVARWLKERSANDGRLIPITAAVFEPAWLEVEAAG
jgi:excinuclease UvrABC nuclease subunit